MNPSDKIDKAFLSKALGQEYDILDFQVTPGSKPGDNFLSLIYTVDVKLLSKSNNTTLSRHILVKCYPTHPGRQDYNNNTNLFFKELQVYRIWLPELLRFQTEVVGLDEPLTLPYPPFVHGKAIDFTQVDPSHFTGKVIDSLDNFIMMEDIRKTWGFRMTNRRESLDIHHIRLVIPALAKLHALSWSYKTHVDADLQAKFPFLKIEFREQDIDTWTTVSTGNLEQAICVLEKELGEKHEITKGVINFKQHIKTVMAIFTGTLGDSAYEEILRLKADKGVPTEASEPWKIITHGDCWSNNMLFRYDSINERPLEVTLVDIQMAQESCLTDDLVYLIYASTRSVLRKNYLDEILQLYFDRFNEICVQLDTPTLPGFTMESLKAKFHRAKVLGFVFATMLLPIVLQDEDDALDLEKMDHEKDLMDMMHDVRGDQNGSVIYRERVLELAQEMYDQGII